ncbi:transcriptional regulator FtrA [Trinickia dabaoshanensis]|uniref:Transcriptional regulator FtrA n=1 Tax=Trinickia dabaoshanensis TaxID=564714 RepID=A0A2N7VX28_9BURK|nr:transcriptional regulator FtrA [Trinickia dabaoshanensis]PMS21706.1 transcriptional regulator FtrA [Trinickia dabaoshanensis]
MQSHLVVAVAYDRLCTFEFGCVVELFALPRPELEVPWYRFAVCAAEDGPIHAAGGITLFAPYTLKLLDRADTIVIPGWRDADEAPPEPLLRKLRAAARRGARLCSICSGVFVLAAAGVLDGKTVTTHWRYAEKLKARYPALRVEPDALYVDEGAVMTSAGSAAGLDMLLHLVRRDHGAAVANRVAQRLVVPPHRDGGQAQFVPRPMPPEDDGGRLARLIDWMRAHAAAEHTVESLARRASMSARTLQRRFREATGLGPYDWLIRERVALAKDMLETRPRLSISVIAQRAGFGSEESLRRHFRRIALTSPAAYRQQFAQPRAAR